jgi:hypothetical protein
MEIKKFENFIIQEKIEIPEVVDIVIDNNGNIVNCKGYVHSEKVNKKKFAKYIIGDDREKYPAGIDKNGKLFAIYQEFGVATNLEKNETLKMPKEYSKKYGNVWRIWREGVPEESIRYIDYIDYRELVPTKPTGWVNVKIDMEVQKRIKRYALSLGHNRGGIDSLTSKLEELERMSSEDIKFRHKKRSTIQKEMSVIIMLHYINEIKNFFTPGSAGSIFESFIAGLIPNSKVIDDNSEADIIANNLKYQIKLYSGTESYIPVNTTEVNFYVIGLKYADRIDIYLLTSDLGGQNRPDNYYIDFKKGNRTIKSEEKFSVKLLKELDGTEFAYKIELLDIESKIKKIADGLKESLELLYSELSKFQYNVETIVSGVDEKGKILSASEFTSIVKDSNMNIEDMEKHLEGLIRSIKIDLVS